MIVLDVELTAKNIIEELGHLIDGSLQGLSFCLPKIYGPYKQPTRNISHLHGIAWSSGKLDYDKLFALFYDKKFMNAEVFAKGFEKCRPLTRLLGQNVEILEDYACSKFKISLEKEKRTVRGPALVTLRDTKQGFTVPRGKQKCMENGLCIIQILQFCTSLMYLCLLLIQFF